MNVLASRRARLFAIAIVSAAVHVAIGSYIASGEPGYFVDYRLAGNPDAIDYVRLGENFWSRGEYSRQTGPPHVPDLLRTPMYPLLAGGVQTLFGVIWPLYALQVGLAMLTALLVAETAAALFGPAAGFAAGLAFAADPGMAILTYQPMSESLFIIWFTLALWLWVRDVRRGGRIKYVSIGLLLGFAILTRPAALYAPVALAMGTVFVQRQCRWRMMVAACCVMAVAYLTVAPWIVRNHAVHRIARLTNADTVNLLYFAGAGVYQVQHRISREQAQAQIAREYQLPDIAQTNNIWRAGGPAHVVDDRQRRVARDILLSNPEALARSTATGLVKAAIAHNANDLAAMSGRTWTPPGLGRILSLELRSAWNALSRNASMLIGFWLYQVGLAIAILALAFVGMVAALIRRPMHEAVPGLLMIGGYLVLTIAVVGIDAYARHRAPLLPLASMFAGTAVAWVCLPVLHALRAKPPMH